MKTYVPFSGCPFHGPGSSFPGKLLASWRPPRESFTGCQRSAGQRSCPLGSGVGLVFGPLLSRGAADILGKAILPLKGVSGVLAPQALRTKCQSYPLPHGQFQMLPELKTSAGVRRHGTRAVRPAGPTPCSSAMHPPSPRHLWVMSLRAT